MIFPPFGNALLPPSEVILMKVHTILYPKKKKIIYIIILLDVSVFDNIITNIIRIKALECHSEGIDSYFTKIEKNRILFYRGSLQDFYCKKGTHVSLYVACLHFNVEIIKMRQYLTNILKCDTSSDFTKEKIDQWLDSFKKLQKKYIITPKESYNY